MIISEAIKKLEELRTKHGDVELHLEVGKDQECKHCGEFKYKSFCGTCINISTINIYKEGIQAWLVAKSGE